MTVWIGPVPPPEPPPDPLPVPEPDPLPLPEPLPLGTVVVGVGVGVGVGVFDGGGCELPPPAAEPAPDAIPLDDGVVVEGVAVVVAGVEALAVVLAAGDVPCAAAVAGFFALLDECEVERCVDPGDAYSITGEFPACPGGARATSTPANAPPKTRPSIKLTTAPPATMPPSATRFVRCANASSRRAAELAAPATWRPEASETRPHLDGDR
ncbi:MAG: hypothetical protein ACYDD4_11775 [Acidimicrobiales bacterium]